MFQEKTFLEITYLVLIIISSLFALVLAAGALSQLFATGLVGGNCNGYYGVFGYNSCFVDYIFFRVF